LGSLLPHAFDSKGILSVYFFNVNSIRFFIVNLNLQKTQIFKCYFKQFIIKNLNLFYISHDIFAPKYQICASWQRCQGADKQAALKGSGRRHRRHKRRRQESRRRQWPPLHVGPVDEVQSMVARPK